MIVTHIMRYAAIIVESRERRCTERLSAAQVISMPLDVETVAPLRVHSLSDCSSPLHRYPKPW